jgi:hypothetical protein
MLPDMLFPVSRNTAMLKLSCLLVEDMLQFIPFSLSPSPNHTYIPVSDHKEWHYSTLLLVQFSTTDMGEDWVIIFRMKTVTALSGPLVPGQIQYYICLARTDKVQEFLYFRTFVMLDWHNVSNKSESLKVSDDGAL